MTVQELIDQLKQYPPEVLVILNDNEGGGYDDIDKVIGVRILPNFNKFGYGGPHENAKFVSDESKKNYAKEPEQLAVLLN